MRVRTHTRTGGEEQGAKFWDGHSLWGHVQHHKDLTPSKSDHPGKYLLPDRVSEVLSDKEAPKRFNF